MDNSQSFTGRLTNWFPEQTSGITNGPCSGVTRARLAELHAVGAWCVELHDAVNYKSMWISGDGPIAPKRKRRKRLAKKLAKRGGMLRSRRDWQSYLRVWPKTGVLR